MSNLQEGTTTQQQIDEQFVKQQGNFFYESISTKLKNNQNSLMEILMSIPSSIQNDESLTRKQFEILGCLSYFVGIDFINNPTDLAIQTRVAERFQSFGINETVVSVFLASVENIEFSLLQKSAEKLKNEVKKPIFIEPKDKVSFNVMKLFIKQIVANSIIPVNLSVAADELVDSSHNYTYEDILKANSMINRQCKFLGSAATGKYIKLNSMSMWVESLNKSLIKFDNQKLAVVYLDTIISTKELMSSIGIYNVTSVLTGNLSDFKLDEIKEKQVEEVPETEIESKIESNTEEAPNNYTKLSDEESKVMMTQNPVRFVYEVLSDVNKKYPTKSTEVIDAIESCLEDNDFAQNLYKYIKVAIQNAKTDDFYFPGFTQTELETLMNVKFEELKQEYKSLMELTCAELPEKVLTKVVNYINACINDLVLDSDDQKQYLITQLLENGVTTYQHLHQIMELIESCDIIGSQLSSYSMLNKYINEQEDIVNIFEKTSKTNDVQLKMSFYHALKTFFTIFVPKKEYNGEEHISGTTSQS